MKLLGMGHEAENMVGCSELNAITETVCIEMCLNSFIVLLFEGLISYNNVIDNFNQHEVCS